MKLAALLLITAAATGCVYEELPLKKPFPQDRDEQADALFYNANHYEAPACGWDEARRRFWKQQAIQ